jgi:UDP-N-acetyl-D-mannosaminuronic acid transferase (WecB/TagA/CpsF family)
MSAIQSASLADEIRSARADVLVVSLGKDRGQQWVDCYGSATGARLLLPFGALRSSRRTNLDVFYRLMREPRRLVCRYLIQGPIALARAISAQLFLSEGVHFVAASTRETTAAPAAPARVSTGRP